MAGETRGGPDSTYLVCLLGSCWLLCVAIQLRTGFYEPVALAVLLVGVALAVVAAGRLPFSQGNGTTAGRGLWLISQLMAGGVVSLAAMGLFGSQGYSFGYASPQFPHFSRGIGLLVLALASSYWLDRMPPGARSRGYVEFARRRFWMIVSLVCAVKALVIFTSYSWQLDVWQVHQTGAKAFFAGDNPYAVAVWTGPTGPAKLICRGFIYPPTSLLATLPFYALLGDIRFTMLAGELAALALLRRLIARAPGCPVRDRLAELVLLLAFVQPRGVAMTETGWNEPIVLGFIAAALYTYATRDDHGESDVLLALGLSAKQYMIFGLPPALILFPRQWRPFRRMAAAGLIVSLPFVLRGPGAFVDGIVAHFLELPPRPDGLNVTAFFMEHGVRVARPVGPALAGLVMVAATIWLRRCGVAGYLHAVTLSLLALFLFGQQAFYNYYYLIVFMQVAAAVFYLAAPVVPNAPPSSGVARKGAAS